MKIKLLLFIVMVAATITKAEAQYNISYFLLDKSQHKGFKFNHVKCNDGMYSAELFNVFYDNDKNILTLFTALPSLEKKVPNWTEIKLDTITNKLITADSLNSMYKKAATRFGTSFLMQGIDREKEASLLKSEYIKPVININGKFFTPSTPTLMEHFELINTSSDSERYVVNAFPNLSQFFEININIPVYSLKKFEDQYIKKFKHPSFNSGGGPDYYNTYYAYNKPILLRNENVVVDGKTAYRFWTLASWMIDGRNNERGIDRFTYIPGTGIVGGAFTYYFRLNAKRTIKTSDQLVEKYLNDKQMMPYEINGKVLKK